MNAILRRRRSGGSGLGPYLANNVPSAGVLDFARSVYSGVDGRVYDPSEIVDYTGASNKTMVDASGVLKWAPHNLVTYSEDFSNADWTKDGTSATSGRITEDTSTGSHRVFGFGGVTVTATQHTNAIEVKPNGRTRVRLVNNNLAGSTFDLVGDGSVVSGAGTIQAMPDGWYLIESELVSPTTERLVLHLDDGTGTSYTGDGASGVFLRKARLYRSDLGGMANNPLRGDSYVPTTGSAVYMPRYNSHLYDGTSWVNNGLFLESEARTQLLHTTDALVTQSHTVTAVPHTLHFTGTGTVTLSGASTAGPLVGTGTGEQNRVRLTFTPSAASLTLTVSGTVSDAQLEVGATPSSYIPNLAASGTVTRAAETLELTAAKNPLVQDGMPTALSIAMKGQVTYSDNDIGVTADGQTSEVVFASWRKDNSNYLFSTISTGGAATGQFALVQEAAGTFDLASSSADYYSPGINVPFNIASAHTTGRINGAVDGTALTEDATPTALPDLSATDMDIGYDFMGHISRLALYSADVTDDGLEEITT